MKKGKDLNRLYKRLKAINNWNNIIHSEQQSIIGHANELLNRQMKYLNKTKRILK